MEKVIPIYLDLVNPPSHTLATLVKGDHLLTLFKLCITQNSKPFNLSEATDARINFKFPGGTKVRRYCEFIDQPNGILQYKVRDTDLQVPGVVTGEVNLFKGNEHLYTSFFYFKVRDSLAPEPPGPVPEGTKYVQNINGLTGETNILGEEGIEISTSGHTIKIKKLNELPSTTEASTYKYLTVTPTGLTWADGPAGARGERGEKGEQGERGEIGPKGTDGLRGIQGIQGEQGIQGIQGLRGFKGETGEKGDKGEKGDRGERGPQGFTGDTGSQGIQGIQGIQGNQGEKGDQGDKGDTGAKGDKGDTGERGTDGQSFTYVGLYLDTTLYNLSDVVFYQGSPYICILGNTTGNPPSGTQEPTTYWEYFPILGPKGEKGDKGDIGLKGDQGPKGDKGDVGSKGDQGIQGIQGLKGDPGEKGDKGDIGPQGTQGIQGLKGDTGSIGPQGIQGIQGPIGVKGDTGGQGIQGIQGERGLKGDKGDQGIQGIQGFKGDKGDTGDQGPVGSTGDTGKSAYEIAKDQGYWGTEDDWIRSLQGPSAYEIAKDQGYWGTEEDWLATLKGEQGPTGETGLPGVKGLKGDQGLKGDKGDPGPRGDTGPAGDSGLISGLDLEYIDKLSFKVHPGSIKSECSRYILTLESDTVVTIQESDMSAWDNIGNLLIYLEMDTETKVITIKTSSSYSIGLNTVDSSRPDIAVGYLGILPTFQSWFNHEKPPFRGILPFVSYMGADGRYWTEFTNDLISNVYPDLSLTYEHRRIANHYGFEKWAWDCMNGTWSVSQSLESRVSLAVNVRMVFTGPTTDVSYVYCKGLGAYQDNESQTVIPAGTTGEVLSRIRKVVLTNSYQIDKSKSPYEDATLYGVLGSYLYCSAVPDKDLNPGGWRWMQIQGAGILRK